jgi:hypothetical protein
VGDLLVFHDAGAYGASDVFSNYNSRPLIPEVLVDGDSDRLIRRRQTIGELLALDGALLNELTDVVADAALYLPLAWLAPFDPAGSVPSSCSPG